MLLKKMFPALVFCFVVSGSLAQDKVSEYIRVYSELAIEEMIRTGVPASITLAQGILESQSGESDLARRSNNHFGIKCKTEWTGAKVYHNDDARGECFRSYESAEQSYRDHSDFLKTRAHYAFLFHLDPSDFEGWAHGLKKAGYATNPTYAEKLIGLIRRYNLQEYTLIALERKNGKQQDMFAYAKQEKTTEPVSADTAKEIVPAGIVEQATEKEETPQLLVTAAVVRTGYKASDYPSRPFYINATRVIFANEGTSLLALANEFGISYKKLLEFNELDEAVTGDILPYSQLIFLGKKPKKGEKDIHIVQQDETMEVIAQKEGVQLEFLLAYNRVPKGRQPLTGEKIYLRSNSPVTPKLAESSAKN